MDQRKVKRVIVVKTKNGKMNKNFSTVKRAAQKVRDHIESTLVPDYFGVDLTCACAVSSWTLWRLLKKQGVNANFISGRYIGNIYLSYEKEIEEGRYIDVEFLGDGHCWIEVDKKIIDITATQFDFCDSVCIVKSNERKRKYYIPQKTNSKAIREINQDWPVEQQPKTYKKHLRRLLRAS